MFFSAGQGGPVVLGAISLFKVYAAALAARSPVRGLC